MEDAVDAGFAGLSNRELAARITELAGHLNAANHRWLVLIAEFDRRQGWSDGFTRSCAHWLSWKCGLDLGAAREKVRVARALEALPGISLAMSTGQLSYSKVRVSEGSPTYGVELSANGQASLCLFQTDEKPARLHLAFTARDRRQVAAFYRAALEAGGKDNGPPGLRPHYHANYYAAFVVGPDGHNIEVVCHEPEA